MSGEVTEVIGSLEKRLYDLESGGSVGYTDDGAAEYPGGVAVGTGSDQTTIVANPIDPPTGLVLSTDSLYEVTYVKAEWDDPTDPDVVQHEIIVTDQSNSEIVTRQVVAGTVFRFESQPNTTYEVTLRHLDRLGRSSTSVTDTILTGSDATVPNAPTGFAVTAGLRTVVARWDENVEEDVKNGHGLYEVQLDTANTFDTANLRTERTSATITSFGDLTTGTTYYARVRAIDSSGNQSAWAATASATPSEAGGTDIADGVITTDHIVTAGLDAAVIKFGTMSGDRISANTIDVQKLKTSTLSARTITLASDGILLADGSSGSLILDGNGLSLYDGSGGTGTRTVFLDSATGNASFKGAITATGGSFTSYMTAGDTRIGRDVVSGWDGINLDGASGSPNVLLRSPSTGEVLLRLTGPSGELLEFDTRGPHLLIQGSLFQSDTTGHRFVLDGQTTDVESMIRLYTGHSSETDHSRMRWQTVSDLQTGQTHINVAIASGELNNNGPASIAIRSGGNSGGRSAVFLTADETWVQGKLRSSNPNVTVGESMTVEGDVIVVSGMSMGRIHSGNHLFLRAADSAGSMWRVRGDFQRIDALDYGLTKYVPVRADSYQTASSWMEHKKDIRPFNGIQVVRNAPATEWEYKDLKDDPRQGRSGIRHVGPMLDDLPSIFRERDGLRLEVMVGALWSAVGELIDRTEQLERQGT